VAVLRHIVGEGKSFEKGPDKTVVQDLHPVIVQIALQELRSLLLFFFSGRF
jgi:hypothetical protein